LQTVAAIKILNEWDTKGRYVFTKRDLVKLLGDAADAALNKTLIRLAHAGVLLRAARGVYVYAQSSHIDGYTIEVIAAALRRAEYNFVSLESALSDYGVISQIPIDRLTVMTSGRSGEFKTPFGVIEFTHTDRNPMEILENTIQRPSHPLRIATKEYALTNLRKVARNTDLLVSEDNDDDTNQF
jgi:hypothetical protein